MGQDRKVHVLDMHAVVVRVDAVCVLQMAAILGLKPDPLGVERYLFRTGGS